MAFDFSFLSPCSTPWKSVVWACCLDVRMIISHFSSCLHISVTAAKENRWTRQQVRSKQQPPATKPPLSRPSEEAGVWHSIPGWIFRACPFILVPPESNQQPSQFNTLILVSSKGRRSLERQGKAHGSWMPSLDYRQTESRTSHLKG